MPKRKRSPAESMSGPTAKRPPARLRVAADALSPYLATADGVTVAYVGKAQHAFDVGTARGPRPLARANAGSGASLYFEIEAVKVSGCVP
jgi:hypothetical protein